MKEAAAEWVDTLDLKSWVKNPRKNDPSIKKVADSISKFGFGAPILARKENGEIIAGHTRIKAALMLGLEKVPVRYLELNEKEAHLLALADNRLGEIADWDEIPLIEIMKEYSNEELALAGWSEEDLSKYAVKQLAEIVDEAPEVREGVEPSSQLGEVYELGPHRLVCGDSRDATVWEKLLGDEKIQMVWTDPPYGIAVLGGGRQLSEEKRKKQGYTTLKNDEIDEEGLEAFLRDSLSMAAAHCNPGASWYVAAPPGTPFYAFATVLRELKIWKHTLAMVKDAHVFGRCDYHYRHEAIFYGWVPDGSHYFADDHTQNTVFEVKRGEPNKSHPTMKEVGMVQKQIENSSKLNWIVCDPFGGSGTTLIAAAKANRTARLIELEPKYCDVIRRRWTALATAGSVDPGSGKLV